MMKMTKTRQQPIPEVAPTAPTEDIEVVSVEGSYTHNSSPKATQARRSPRMVSLVLGMGALVAVAIGVGLYFRNRHEDLLNTPVNANYQGTVSSAALAEHNVASDCWLLIHDNVYDLTDYAPRHPGGAEWITDFCGKDGTRDFDAFHPESLLKTARKYLLGTLGSANDTVKDAETVAEENAPKDDTTPQNRPTTEEVDSDEDSFENENNDNSDENNDQESDEDEEDEEDDSEYEEEGTYQKPNPDVPATTTSPPPTPTPVTEIPTETGCQEMYYTAEDVASHADTSDCWYILYDVVYDMTDYIYEHPGGSRVVFQECGTDATVVYSNERKHDEQLLAEEIPHLVIGKLGTVSGWQQVAC
jgi:cytochrome b involved in lipid metabolism